MNRTKIEWADFTWNIITGCLGPLGTLSRPGRCPYCYARKLARGRLKKLYLSNTNIVDNGDPTDPFTPRFWPSRLIEPFKLKKPSKIFVSSMGELFSHAYPQHWFSCILYTICKNPRHTFILLTKKPSAALDFRFPSNVWLGVTITSPADWWRLPLLLRSKAKVKFISFEPLLEDVLRRSDLPAFSGLPYIDWIIIGAQTRPDFQPLHNWVYRIVDAARHDGTPIFLKPNLHWPGPPIQEFPSELTLSRKVEQPPHSPPRTLFKSGDLSQQITNHRGSPNAKNFSPGQGQPHDKTRGGK